MQKQNRTMKMNNKGFSLAEIMIVMVIIGAILGFVLPRIQAGNDNSKVRNTRMKMGEIETKITEFQADCSKLPQSLDFLVNDVADCRNWTSNKKSSNLLKDEFGTPFSYELSGNGYILKSFGKDKKEGGSGPEKDIYSEGSEGGGEE